MEVEYVAFDSFGVKSSCVLIKTSDVRICVDPGIAVETGSFPLPWHVKLALGEKYRLNIAQACSEADVITISHYHYDHHQPIQAWYEGKVLLIKNPGKAINKSQKERAGYFLQLIKGVAEEIKIADDKEFKFGETTIRFSKPLWHGVRGSALGYVLTTTVSTQRYKILHSSDIDGPTIEQYTDHILRESPDLLILDGAPTYLLGYIHAYYNLCRSVLNLRRLIKSRRVKKIILDHHALRDYRYKDLYHLAFKSAKEHGVELHTAAEEIDKKPAVLEGYEKYGSTKWKHWNKIEEEDMQRILNNAREHKLLGKETIELIGRELKGF
jgi:hypothetical protein